MLQLPALRYFIKYKFNFLDVITPKLKDYIVKLFLVSIKKPILFTTLEIIKLKAY